MIFYSVDDIWRIWIKQVENCLASEQSLGSWKGDSCVLCQVRPFKIYKSDRHFYPQESLGWRQKIYRYDNKENQERNKNHYTKLLLKCFYLNGNTFRFINKRDQTYHLTNMTGEKFISTAESRCSKVSQKRIKRMGGFIVISAFHQIVAFGLISLFF